MSNSPDWLDLSEYLAIAVAVVGVIAAANTATWIYALVPILISTILNAINRWRLQQYLRSRDRTLERKLAAELQQQGEALQQEISQARSFATALVKQTMATQKEPAALAAAGQQEVTALEQKFDIQKQLMQSMQAHVAGVEGSLKDVVDLLEGTALNDRVEHLERHLTLMSQQLGFELPTTDLEATRLGSYAVLSDRDEPDIDIMPLLDMISEDLMSGDLISADLTSGDLTSGDLSGDLWSKPTWNLNQTISAHGDWVRCLSFTPDGTKLVSGSFDKTIKLWQLDTGAVIHTLAEHPKGIFALAVSPDGRLLASGSWDETIKLWDLASGTLLHNLVKHTASVRSLAISPDSRTLIGGSFDRTIVSWQIPEGIATQTIEARDPIAAIALSADGQVLASTGDDGKIELWSIPSGRALGCCVGNQHCIGSLAIAPDGRTIGAGTVNGYVILWQLANLDSEHGQHIEPAQSIKAHAGQINACVFSPDGEYLITGSVDGKAKVWYKGEDLSFRNKARSILKGDPGRSVMSVAIDGDGDSIAVGGADGTIQIWQRV
jgi:WD40 repeat protein